MQALKTHTAFARLHEVPSKQLPPWVHLYFSGTRFWDTVKDQWFVPFEGEGPKDDYAQRRGAIDRLLATGYAPTDVKKVGSCSVGWPYIQPCALACTSWSMEANPYTSAMGTCWHA